MNDSHLAIIMDRGGKAIWLSDKAYNEISTTKLLALNGDNSLRFKCPRLQNTFRMLVSEMSRNGGHAETDLITVTTPDAEAVRIRVSALIHSNATYSRDASEGAQENSSFLIEVILPLRRKVQTSALSQQHGLTPAECELAAAIYKGQSVSYFARAKRLSEDTVRKRLKVIFGKTCVNRQTELVKFLDCYAA